MSKHPAPRRRWNAAAPRWLYFTSFVWLATYGRFSSVLLEEIGFSATQLGAVIGSARLISLVASPALAAAADQIEDPWVVGAVLVALQCASALLLFAAGTFLPALGGVAPAVRLATCGCLFVFGIVAVSAFFPILDALTVEAVGSTAYADERLWGAVSWGVAHLMLGSIADWSGSMRNIALVNPAATAVFGVFYICFRRAQRGESTAAQPLPVVLAQGADAVANAAETSRRAPRDEAAAAESAAQAATAADPPRRAPFRELRVVLLTPLVATFLVVCAVLSGAVSCVTNLLFLFMKDGLGSSNVLCGASVIVTVVFEIPIFIVARRVQKVLRVRGLVIVAMSAYVLRGVGYSLVPRAHPALILAMEPLHGVTYSCIKIAQVSFLKAHSPPGWEATMQSLASAVGGLGSMVGVVAGGFVIERFGAKLLYLAAAVCVGAALVVYVGVSQCEARTAVAVWAPAKVAEEAEALADEAAAAEAEGLAEEEVEMVPHWYQGSGSSNLLGSCK